MTIKKLRRNLSPSMIAKVAFVAVRKKISFEEALIFLLREVVSPKTK